MKKLANSPHLMTCICNIQNMNEYIHGLNYDRIKDFKRLEKLTDDELFDEQNSIIPMYNEKVNLNGHLKN